MNGPSVLVSKVSERAGNPPVAIEATLDPAAIARVRPDAQQRNGKILVVSGWVLTVASAVLYCLACFGAAADADVGEILANGSVPYARTALGVAGIGTLLWLVGSFTYLRAAMEALESGSDDGTPPG